MEDKKIFDREEHFCPYNKNASCSGWSCGTDCPIHPDYEDEYDSELEKELDDAYSAGWNQGYKKGYIAAMEDEDNWVEDEDEEYCDCDCCTRECPFADEEDIDWEDYIEENDDIYEKLFQSGDLVPEVAKAYEKGKNYGYKIGLSEGSSIAEENYALGYKECLVGNPPCIYDEELEELLEQNKSFSVDNVVYDTDFLDCVKELQDKISKLHKYSDNSEFRKEIYDIFHLITVITENQVMKPVYQYWVDLEDR